MTGCPSLTRRSEMQTTTLWPTRTPLAFFFRRASPVATTASAMLQGLGRWRAAGRTPKKKIKHSATTTATYHANREESHMGRNVVPKGGRHLAVRVHGMVQIAEDGSAISCPRPTMPTASPLPCWAVGRRIQRRNLISTTNDIYVSLRYMFELQAPPC